MRIGIQDNWHLGFSGVLKKDWEAKGHTVLFEPGFNPELIETCDRVFFESADSSTHLATQQRPYKKGKIFVRIVDIDMHVNGPAGIQPGYFDGIIYIAEHIKQMSETRFKNLEGIPSALIPMGVDIDKFTYRVKMDNRKIAFISNRLTAEKGFDKALLLFADLCKKSDQYELHVVGRMFENSVWQMHIEHILDANNLRGKVFFYGNLPRITGREINDFLEDKDFLLSLSHKEAFSFVTAEAMCKGVKPVVYNFYGARSIWPSDILFKTPGEAIDMITANDYNPQHYRLWIEENYPLKKHLDAINNFMEIS